MKDELAFDREVISNIRDQLRHPNSTGKKPIARIYVHKLRRQVVIIDELTGIMDMEDFTGIGTETTSRESGKTVGDETNSYENINPEITGQKHFGKLSCLYASKTGEVEFYSNNGQNGHYLKCNYEGWDLFDSLGNPTDRDYGLTFKTIDRNEALPHVGLKIVIGRCKGRLFEDKQIRECNKEMVQYLAQEKENCSRNNRRR